MMILACGGGTMGPVIPLITVLRQMRKYRSDLSFAWAGTPNGPEREVIEKEGIPFYSIPVAKIPRYLSLDWVRWPFQHLAARRVARSIIQNLKPALIVSAGGFTGVSVMQEARTVGIPCAIHQLDVVPGLSNRRVAGFCASVTTSFRYQKPPFRNIASEQISTPCRFANKSIVTKTEAAKFFGLDPNFPILFVTGGGTGAAALNQTIWETVDTLLTFTQVIHLTGKGKGEGRNTPRSGYLQADFFQELQMFTAYCAADLIVSRAGLGSLSELACLSKPTILVPIPRSHQEYNTSIPVPIVHQNKNFATTLLRTIKNLIENETHRLKISQRIHEALPTDDGSALAEKWLKILENSDNKETK